MAATEQLPLHSPLGGSAVYRFVPCPGSVGLSAGIDDEEDDTFSKPGTVAHAVGERCLGMGDDAWEAIGHHYDAATTRWYPPAWFKTHKQEAWPENTVAVDKEMADAVQVYLDAVRLAHPDRHQGNFFVERRFHVPSLHQFYYGTADAVYIDEPKRTLHIWDYKHGAGIVVDAEHNEQEMYYAAGVLEELQLWDAIDTIVLHIVQPRGWHWAGPVRHWSLTTDALDEWLTNTLLPAMDRALTSTETKTGEHCRFCPARFRHCPALWADIEELEALMTQFNLSEKGQAAKLTGEQVARVLNLGETFKIAQKAALATAMQRLENGASVPGWKLASKKANREWKEGAEARALVIFGKDAYTKPELKSPAQIEGLPGGEAFAAEYAFKPETGLTVTKSEDVRPAVSRDTKSGFTPVKRGKK